MKFLAYIDPGTGSFALQAALGVIMGISYAVRNHVRAFMAKFKKGPKTVKPDETR